MGRGYNQRRNLRLFGFDLYQALHELVVLTQEKHRCGITSFKFQIQPFVVLLLD